MYDEDGGFDWEDALLKARSSRLSGRPDGGESERRTQQEGMGLDRTVYAP